MPCFPKALCPSLFLPIWFALFYLIRTLLRSLRHRAIFLPTHIRASLAPVDSGSSRLLLFLPAPSRPIFPATIYCFYILHQLLKGIYMHRPW